MSLQLLPEDSTVRFDELEKILRSHEVQLCAETTQRYTKVLTTYFNANDYSNEAMATKASYYIHHLVIVVAALYPSETTLRQEYSWAATGQLHRLGIGFREQAMLLQTYCAAAKTVLTLSPMMQQALDTLERFMLEVASDVFQQRAE